MRVTVHNYVGDRRVNSASSFKATRVVARSPKAHRDHAHAPGEDCHCGGSCDICSGNSRPGLRDRFQRDTGRDHERTNLIIDVVYLKGGYGRPRQTEARHYDVPGVLVDPRGYAPQPAFVMGELGKQPEHRSMVKAGWEPEKIEGYYKQTRNQMSGLGRKEV